MSTDEKMSRLITQVLRATYSGSIRWDVAEPPASMTRATDSFVPLFFSAHYKNTDIVVYEERSKYWTDEDTYSWTSNIHFGVVVGGVVISDYAQYSPALRELFEQAKKDASNIDSLLDNLLD